MHYYIRRIAYNESDFASPAMINSLLSNQQRVLVADDERIIADTLQIILKQQGFAVAVAYDGNSAIEKSRYFSPEILLCDVVMPDVNGVEVAVQVHTLYPECKVLLFSGREDVHHLLQEARLDGHEFELLLKPVHPSDLLARLRSLS